MARIRLYTQKTNPYSEKVARVLNYKGLRYERIESDDPEDIQRWSPVTKQLPVLEIDGERVHDSAAILRRLGERFPEPPLLSKDPVVAAAQERFAEWSDSSVAWYWNRWRAARYPQPGDEQPGDQSLLRKLRSGLLRGLGLPDQRLSRAQLRELEVTGELARRMDDLVGMLGDRPFFHGEEISVADLAVFGMLLVLRDSPITGGGTLLTERPTLLAFLERVDELTRPRPDSEAR